MLGLLRGGGSLLLLVLRRNGVLLGSGDSLLPLVILLRRSDVLFGGRGDVLPLVVLLRLSYVLSGRLRSVGVGFLRRRLRVPLVLCLMFRGCGYGLIPLRGGGLGMGVGSRLLGGGGVWKRGKGKTLRSCVCPSHEILMERRRERAQEML